jgi:hypothetical protein
VSPYGCAFFDSRMSKEQADPRSVAGMNEIANAWMNNEILAEIAGMLYARERIALATQQRTRQDGLRVRTRPTSPLASSVTPTASSNPFAIILADA